MSALYLSKYKFINVILNRIKYIIELLWNIKQLLLLLCIVYHHLRGACCIYFKRISFVTGVSMLWQIAVNKIG